MVSNKGATEQKRLGFPLAHDLGAFFLCKGLILWYKSRKEKDWERLLTMREERRFPRALIDTQYCLIGKRGAAKGKAKNISPVGVFVRTGDNWHVGDRVHITVNLPQYHGSVLSQAEVVWICTKNGPCGDRGVGLKWIDLSITDVFRLDNFVRHWEES